MHKEDEAIEVCFGPDQSPIVDFVWVLTPSPVCHSRLIHCMPASHKPLFCRCVLCLQICCICQQSEKVIERLRNGKQGLSEVCWRSLVVCAQRCHMF